MPRFQCGYEGCGSRHYDGETCQVSGHSVDHRTRYTRESGNEEVHCGPCHDYPNYYYGRDCGGHCLTSMGNGALVDRTPPDPNAPIARRTSAGVCGVCGARSHEGPAHGELWWQESSRDHTSQTADATDKALSALRATLAAEAPKD